jgi:uncharacterized paraquat-inducible protein A
MASKGDTLTVQTQAPIKSLDAAIGSGNTVLQVSEMVSIFRQYNDGQICQCCGYYEESRDVDKCERCGAVGYVKIFVG